MKGMRTNIRNERMNERSDETMQKSDSISFYGCTHFDMIHFPGTQVHCLSVPIIFIRHGQSYPEPIAMTTAYFSRIKMLNRIKNEKEWTLERNWRRKKDAGIERFTVIQPLNLHSLKRCRFLPGTTMGIRFKCFALNAPHIVPSYLTKPLMLVSLNFTWTWPECVSVWPHQQNDEENRPLEVCALALCFTFQTLYRNVLFEKCLHWNGRLSVGHMASRCAERSEREGETRGRGVGFMFVRHQIFTSHFYSSRWMIRTNIVLWVYDTYLYIVHWVWICGVSSSCIIIGCVMLAHDTTRHDKTMRQNRICCRNGQYDRAHNYTLN